MSCCSGEMQGCDQQMLNLHGKLLDCHYKMSKFPIKNAICHYNMSDYRSHKSCTISKDQLTIAKNHITKVTSLKPHNLIHNPKMLHRPSSSYVHAK